MANKDSDVIDAEDNGSMIDVMATVYNRLSLKKLLALFFIILIVFSDIFVEYVIRPIQGTTEIAGIRTITTTSGTMLQALIVVLLYIIADLAISYI